MSTVTVSQPHVAIIIPCFNRASLVGDAIESALKEGSKDVNVEVIAIDDGSTDSSWNVIQSFGTRVVAKQTENRGVAAARNTGISLSSAIWVKFLDSDDQLIEGSINQQLRQAAALTDQEVPVGRLSCHKNHVPFDDLGVKLTAMDLSSDSLQVSQPLFPKAAIDAVGGFRNSSISEDYELVIRCFLAGWRFVQFNNSVVQFRNTEDSDRLSKNLTSQRFEELIKVYQRLLSEISKIQPCAADELRLGLGKNAWSMARRATRFGYLDSAHQLFEIAYKSGGTKCRKARFPVALMYSLLSPVTVELFLQRLKQLRKANG